MPRSSMHMSHMHSVALVSSRQQRTGVAQHVACLGWVYAHRCRLEQRPPRPLPQPQRPHGMFCCRDKGSHSWQCGHFRGVCCAGAIHFGASQQRPRPCFQHAAARKAIAADSSRQSRACAERRPGTRLQDPASPTTGRQVRGRMCIHAALHETCRRRRHVLRWQRLCGRGGRLRAAILRRGACAAERGSRRVRGAARATRGPPRRMGVWCVCCAPRPHAACNACIHAAPPLHYNQC